jgi:hypothetical protein
MRRREKGEMVIKCRYKCISEIVLSFWAGFSLFLLCRIGVTGREQKIKTALARIRNHFGLAS